MPYLNSLIKKLTSIRHDEDWRGLCLACSLESAKILIKGSAYEPERVSNNRKSNKDLNENDIINLHQELIAKNKSQLSDPTESREKAFDATSTRDDFLNYFQQAIPGSVFVISNEDHTFNIFVSNEARVYLIDSDVHIFKEIKNSEDLIFPLSSLTGNKDDEDDQFDYTKSSENEHDTQTAYYVGKLHSDWEKKVFSFSHTLFEDKEKEKRNDNEELNDKNNDKNNDRSF